MGTDRSIFGATYNRSLCLTGFDHGLLAVLLLVQGLRYVRPQTGEWVAQYEALYSAVLQWRETMASSLGPEQAADMMERR